MRRQKTGYYQSVTTVGSRPVRAFIPYPLPPEPHIRMEGALLQSMEQALLSLGRLDSLTERLPGGVDWLLYSFLLREALLSSQIEGTRSTFPDLLLFENKAAPKGEARELMEVHNYVRALGTGMGHVGQGGLLSNRLFLELHAVLLGNGRGGERSPGRFRQSVVWIGGAGPTDADIVPPPHLEVPACMAALEKFLNTTEDGLPALVRIALAHVQFEIIHPFHDGNGRLGRLLIILFLCRAGILQEPLLYLSLYLKRHRPQYYALLQQVRLEGDWEQWLAFFFTAVRETAADALDMSVRLLDLFTSEREHIENSGGRRAGSALRVHEVLQRRLMVSISELCRQTRLSQPAVASSLELLVQLGIAHEVTGLRRNRLFAALEYIEILKEGTEPL